MPSEDDLSEVAKIAYQAFVDMTDSKTAHFNCLAALDQKYEAGGGPSLAENLELERLLTHHDRNVVAFKTAMAAVTDESEKQALIALMSA